MRLTTRSASAVYEFACHSKACAPPPAGTGGSDRRMVGRRNGNRPGVGGKISDSANKYIASETAVKAPGYRYMNGRSLERNYKGTRYPKDKRTADLMTGGRTSGHTSIKVKVNKGSKLFPLAKYLKGLADG